MRLPWGKSERVTRQQLLEDVWRMGHDPQTNSVEVHVSRLRSKLAAAGCAQLVQTVPEGGYRLTGDLPFMFPRPPVAERDALDRYLLDLDWTQTAASAALRDEMAQNRR
ncbi:MAG: winged helix-turn-helix domain-containing protein [Pseudomonadota bacterium]